MRNSVKTLVNAMTIGAALYATEMLIYPQIKAVAKHSAAKTKAAMIHIKQNYLDKE